MTASGAPLRAAVVGLGSIGNLFDLETKRTEVWTHAGAYAELANVELVGGADPDSGAREHFESMRGVAAFADVKTMLAETRPDLVSVAVPTALHADVACEVIESGIPSGVVVEKPLAADPASAWRVVEAARDAGVVLQVMHQLRYLPTYRAAKCLIQSGDLGEVVSLVGHFTSRTLNMGSHLIDLMRYLGGEIVSVVGYLARGDDPSDPTYGGIMQFASGAVGHLLSNGTRNDLIFEVTVTGTEGRVEVRRHGAELHTYRLEASDRYEGYREPVQDESVTFPESRPAIVEALADLAHCVRESGQPLCTGYDSYRDVLVIDALARSAASHLSLIELAAEPPPIG